MIFTDEEAELVVFPRRNRLRYYPWLRRVFDDKARLFLLGSVAIRPPDLPLYCGCPRPLVGRGKDDRLRLLQLTANRFLRSVNLTPIPMVAPVVTNDETPPTAVRSDTLCRLNALFLHRRKR